MKVSWLLRINSITFHIIMSYILYCYLLLLSCLILLKVLIKLFVGGHVHLLLTCIYSWQFMCLMFISSMFSIVLKQ
jgi:hypothetical protein